MTDILNASELVEPLKRAIAGPGQFDAAFPDADDDTLFSYVIDAFGDARLDKTLIEGTVDWVTGEFSPELSQAQAALVVIYASMNILSTQIRNTGTKNKYKAGPVEFETEYSAGVLQAALAAMERRKEQIIKSSYSTVPYFLDGYWGRLTGGYSQTDPWS